ncbi:MAG: ribonuclease III [Synergistes sp.]|nr:ribonuclease III [Synergistes sp.]
MKTEATRLRELDIYEFQLRLGHFFNDKRLLNEALTHSSFANENGGKYNERLEYLGDAVLELASSRRLFFAFPDYDEGKLTQLRSQIVCKTSLAKWADKLKLKKIMRIGKSLEKTGVTDSMAADCAEAIFGAVFLDAGYDKATVVIDSLFSEKFGLFSENIAKDPKSMLQELCQHLQLGIPHYETVERSGPEHDLRFKVRLTIKDKVISETWGSCTKEAEFAAARDALRIMREGNRI